MNAKIVRRLAAVFGVMGAFFLSGCGGDSGSSAPQQTSGSGGARTIELSKALTADQAEMLLENGQKQLLTGIRPLIQSNLVPFKGTALYESPGTDFEFAFADGDPPRRISYDFTSNGTYDPRELWPLHTATDSVRQPQVDAKATVASAPDGGIIDDGITVSLENLQSGETFSLAGLGPAQAPEIVYTTNDTYTTGGVVTGHTYYGTASYPSGWKMRFFAGILGGYDSFRPTERASKTIVVLPPPPSFITIANATYDSTSKELDFQINPVNATLRDWSIDLQKDGNVIRSFLPTTDPRGPGLAGGTNPTNVTLTWDGLGSNNTAVSGNVTWVMTARTTNYVSGGPVNDGIDSAQATLNSGISSGPLPIIKTISCDHITLVDVKNKKIETPQFSVITGKHEPMAIPLSASKPRLTVDLSVVLPPDTGPFQYTVWAVEDPLQLDKPFANPVTFEVHRSINERQKFDLNLPPKITRVPSLLWYAQEKFGPPTLIATMTSPLYITLDKPSKPQQEPRVDVLNLAVETQKSNPLTQNKVYIATYLSNRIYSAYRYQYDPADPHHTTFSKPGNPDKMELTVSNFIEYSGNTNLDRKGNCLDFSNLYQVCAASLGVSECQVMRIDGPFDFYPVKPVGGDVPIESEGPLNFHQVGWFEGDNRVYDPTYLLLYRSDPPVSAVNLPLDFYKGLLVDDEKAGQNGRTNTWQPRIPVKILSVK